MDGWMDGWKSRKIGSGLVRWMTCALAACTVEQAFETLALAETSRCATDFISLRYLNCEAGKVKKGGTISITTQVFLK